MFMKYFLFTYWHQKIKRADEIAWKISDNFKSSISQWIKIYSWPSEGCHGEDIINGNGVEIEW